MFETWISDLLASSLGHFIDVQRDKLKFSLWNGVEINNVSIREGAFDYLDLPFKVYSGSIGHLQLQVPWTSLAIGSSPVVVELSDVKLAAMPWEESEWSQPAAMKRATASKQAQLAAAELAALPAKVSADGLTEGTNFKWTLISHVYGAILRRLQLTVKNVDISFEYKTQLLHGGFTFGLQVGHVEMSKDNGTNQHIEGRAQPMNGDIEKSLTLSGVAVYWNTHGSTLDGHAPRQFVLCPVECHFSILFQTIHTCTTQNVQFRVMGHVDGVRIQISDLQLAQMVNFADLNNVWVRRQKYGKFRPVEWTDARHGNLGGAQTPWRSVWQYAIRSVLQDLHDLQPGFSLARLRLWQQWRRRYVYLYRRHMESCKREGIDGCASPAKELRDLETELPVSVVMLFRSLAEQPSEEKEETTEALPSQGIAPTSWFGWGMSGVWSFLGYSSAPSSTHQIPELPSEAQLSELYKALNFQPSSQLEKKEHQRILSFELKLMSVKATLWQQRHKSSRMDEILSIILTSSKLCIDLKEDGCSSIMTCENLLLVDKCSNPGSDRTILKRAHSVDMETDAFLWISFTPENSQTGLTSDPYLRLRVSPVNLILEPKFLRRLKTVTTHFPSSTLSTWIARSISCLGSHRARTLAKAQHLAFSQSKLKIEIALQRIHAQVPAHSAGEETNGIALDFESVHLVSTPVRDMWDYVRVLRHIEQEHPLDIEGGRFVLQGGSESVLFDDLERKLLYRHWEVTIHSLCMGNIVEDGGAAMDHILDKVSGSGSVLVNRMAAEHSSAAVICDWRLSPMKLRASGTQLDILHSLLQTAAESADVSSLDVSSRDLGGDASNLKEVMDHDKSCILQDDLHVDVAMPLACRSTSNYEISISTPGIEANIEDLENNKVYDIGGDLPCSYLASSKTSVFSFVYQGGETTYKVSMAKLNLQDTGNYRGRHITARSAFPRLARNIYIEEFVISHKDSREGDIGVHVELIGAEGTAYPGEIAGYLKPSMPLVRATGIFSYEKCAACNSSKLDIDLSNGCFGSAFIMRTFQFLSRFSESSGHTEEPTSSQNLVNSASAALYTLVGAKHGKSVAISFRIKNCHAVLPKGGQHMAAVLGIPGGHCGVLLKVPEFSLQASYLQGFVGDKAQWSFFEMGMIDAIDIAILASRGSHNCLMTPVLVVDKISLTSSGTCFLGNEFPMEWIQELRTINYNIEITGMKVSMDIPRLEVIACSFYDAVVKLNKLSGFCQDEKTIEQHMVSLEPLGDMPLECCVPYRAISTRLSIPTVSLSFIRPSADQSDFPVDHLSTFLECSGLQVLYSARYDVEGLPEKNTTLSPFQISSKSSSISNASDNMLRPSDVLSSQDNWSPSDKKSVFCQSFHISWEELGLYETRITQEIEAFFYFLTPDGRILQYSRPDERDLIAGELGDSSLAMSLWAPVKVEGADDNLSESHSSSGSFETAGSNFSTGRKTSIVSTAEFCSIEEERLVSDSPRSMSARSDLFEIEDYFLDHMQTEKKPNCAPASPTSKDVSDSVILLKISQSEPCYHCCVTVTKNIGSQKNKGISIMFPQLEVDANICAWVGSLDAALEAARIIEQYKGHTEKKEKQASSFHLDSFARFSVSSFKLTVVCIGQKAGVHCQSTVFYPSLIVNVGSLVGIHKETVSVSVSSISLLSCWVTPASSSKLLWEMSAEPRQLMLMNKLNLEGSLTSSDHTSMVNVTFKLTIDLMKVWFSHHRFVPFLLVMTWVQKTWFQLKADHPEMSDNHRESTSAPSSLLNFIQQYGAGSDKYMTLLTLFGKLTCQFGSFSLMLSDDQSQIDFPLLDANIEHVCLEVKREMNSSLVVWGAELCMMISVYNRQKMGWEALTEPWSLKVSAESRLCRNTIHQSPQNDMGFHTLLRCISDQPIQLTLSDGMLKTIGVIQEIVEATSKLSLETAPIAPSLVNLQSSTSKFFTTHWLHNKTGVGMHFWTTRETLGSHSSSHTPSLYASPTILDNIGIPLRAVAISEKQNTNGIGTRQMSLSELALSRPAQMGSMDSQGTLSPSERSDELPGTSSLPLDLGLRNEKLPSVGENGIQDLLPKPAQKLPVDYNVASHGFEMETNLKLGCENVSFSRHRHMRLYFRLDNQEIACGPVMLDKVGRELHTVRILDSVPNAIDSENVWTKAQVVCDVAQRLSGGFDVFAHSNARMTNKTSIKLEIGCWGSACQADPLVLIISPGDSEWLPVLTSSHGRKNGTSCSLLLPCKGSVRLRPHSVSADPWAMRSAWSAPVYLPQLFHELVASSQVFCHVKCNPVSGGLKPVWLNVGAVKDFGDCFADIQVESPVIVHNFLPVPSEVELRCQKGLILGLRGSINPRCSIQGHTLQGGRVDHITVIPKGYKMAQVDHSPRSEPSSHPASEAELGVMRPSGKDMRVANSIVKIECEGAGSISICMSHCIEGFTGRHTFEMCCALWVYNCTGLPVAVREHQDHEPFVDEEAVRIPDDKVPIRWVPPFLDANKDKEHRTSYWQESASSRQSASSSLPIQSLGEMGGLKDLLQSGDPVKFKIRSGWSTNQTRSKRNSLYERRTSGTEWPWMEVDGPPRQGRLRLQLRASRSQAPKGSDYWSSPLSVDSLGGAAIVQAPCPINAAAGRQSFPNGAYYFSVTSHLIPNAGGAWSLLVMPRYLLVNHTSVPIQYRQQSVPVERSLLIHSCTCIQWPDARRPLRLNIRIKESGWLWSGGISLESPGDMFVKVRHRHREETMLLQVDVSMSRSGVLIARLSHQIDGFAPYRLDNCTNEKIHVRQEGCHEQEDVLRPYSSIPYAWDEPSGTHKVVLELSGHRLVGTLKLDQVGCASRVTLQPDPSSPYTNRVRRLHILVVAEGPTRVMVVMDEDIHPSTSRGTFSKSSSHEQLGWHSWSSPLVGQSSKKSRSTEIRTGLEVEMHLSGVGVSFVTAYKELLYAWICEPQLCLAVGRVRYRLECAVSRFQLDNCIRDAVYPVLFRGPASIHSRRHSAMTMRASIWRRRPGGVVCIEQLHLDFAPLALEIEEAHMGELVYFFDSHIRPLISSPDMDRELHQPDVMILEDGRAWSKIVPKAKVYIESLNISRTDLTFSFCPASWRLSGSETTQLKMGPSNLLLQRFLAFADVEAAHIQIKGLELQHPLLSQSALFALVGRHYMRGLVHEVYKIVGSADILGDPVRLVHHLGLGVWSLFSNPASAALGETSNRLEIPQRVLFGFVMGLRSLLSNTIYAFSNATAKLSLTARKGLVLLRLEDESQLRNARRGMTRNARLSLTKSIDSGLVEAILDGLGGLLSEPVRGVEEAGLVGLVRGTMRGLIGVLVRPTARVLEISSRMADSIQAFVSGYQGPLPLMRVPRMVDPCSPLQLYNGLDAVGALVLAEANDGSFQNDVLLSCLEAPSKGRFIIITHRHLLVVSMRDPNSPYSFPKVTMSISLDEVESVNMKGGVVGLLGIPVRINVFARSPFAWWEVECGSSLAPLVASHVLYACKSCPRRVRRVGHAVCVQSHLFIQ